MLERIRRVVALMRDNLRGHEVLRLRRALVLGPAVDRRAQGVLADSHARPAMAVVTRNAFSARYAGNLAAQKFAYSLKLLGRLVTQCAAVMTYLSPMRAPPHLNCTSDVPEMMYPRLASHGNWPRSAS